MNKYLITSDMDNTLLKENKSISFQTRIFLRRLIKKGHHFSFNTGRPYQGTLYQFHQLKLYDEPIICNNGAAIVFLNKDDSIKNAITFPLSNELVKSFFKDAKPYLKCAFASSLNHIYLYNRNFVPCFIIHDTKQVQVFEGDLDSIIEDDILALEFYVKEDCIDQFNELLNSLFYKDKFFMIFWGKFNDVYSFQFQSLDSSKGKAMLYLADYYQIPHSNTIAFGDNLNDNDMIEAAGIGVAMVNAKEKTKEITSYITTHDYNHHGVVKFLKNFFKNLQ